jgi:hypothetical protein
MHSTMRAYAGLVFKTTHGCIGRITQGSRGGASYTGMPMEPRAKLYANDTEFGVDS